MPQTRPRLTEGELWTREQLEALRSERFRPRPIARFLGASRVRARVVRAQRLELARQSRRWLALGAAAYVPARATPAAYAWWAAVAAMLDWHLGMLETPDGKPCRLGAPDAATLARAWLVPLVATEPRAPLVVAGAVSDVLDGTLARATRPTRAGRDLEGLVDFAFGVAALRGLARRNAIARGVVLAEVARTSAGVAYGLAAYFGRARRPSDAVIRAARTTTAVRIIGVAACAAGARRVGGSLVAAGSVWSLARLRDHAQRRA